MVQICINGMLIETDEGQKTIGEIAGLALINKAGSYELSAYPGRHSKAFHESETLMIRAGCNLVIRSL